MYRNTMMDVISIADARAGLSGLVGRFRTEPDAEPVAVGARRRAEAVMLSASAYRSLVDAASGQVTFQRLRELKPVIERLAQASQLSDVRVFGSVARGEQRLGSDVDLLVTPTSAATLFDIAQFEIDMEALLGVPVSVASMASLDPKRDERMLSEAIPL